MYYCLRLWAAKCLNGNIDCIHFLMHGQGYHCSVKCVHREISIRMLIGSFCLKYLYVGGRKTHSVSFIL